MTKHNWMALFVALCCFGLILMAGCTPAEESSGTDQTGETSESRELDALTEEVEQLPDDQDTREKVFIVLARENVEGTAGLSDDELVEFGHLICGRIDDLGNTYAVGAEMMENDISPSDAGYLTGLSISAFCTEYEYMIPE